MMDVCHVENCERLVDADPFIMDGVHLVMCEEHFNEFAVPFQRIIKRLRKELEELRRPKTIWERMSEWF